MSVTVKKCRNKTALKVLTPKTRIHSMVRVPSTTMECYSCSIHNVVRCKSGSPCFMIEWREQHQHVNVMFFVIVKTTTPTIMTYSIGNCLSEAEVSVTYGEVWCVLISWHRGCQTVDDNICFWFWLRRGGGQEHDIDKNRAEGDGSGNRQWIRSWHWELMKGLTWGGV